MTESSLKKPARYSFGGDEFLFVEIADEMSLAAHLRAMSMAQRLSEMSVDGILELCPTNASLLIRYDPLKIAPKKLEAITQGVESETASEGGAVREARIIEVPVWYGDPYTTEVMKRFREGYHQEPDGSDLDYAARVNGLDSAEEFVRRHEGRPWLVSAVGFVAGVPVLYQLTSQENQLEVPKYRSPRPGGTPQLTLGHGGCFGSNYSVEGAGGYQMLGILAGPIFDPNQKLPDFSESMVFFRPGDIVKYRSVDEAEYRKLRAEVEAGTFSYSRRIVEFDPALALADVETYAQSLTEALYVH